MKNQFSFLNLLYSVLFVFILPNLLFFIASFWYDFDRPLINIDYVLPCLLLLTRFKSLKVLGLFIFLLIFHLDILVIVLQFFPSFHFKDSFYLLGYINAGPKGFLYKTIAIIIMLCVELALLWLVAKKAQFKETYVALCLLIPFVIISYVIDLSKGLSSSLYQTSFCYSGSTYFFQNQDTNFNSLLGGDKLLPSPYHSATMPWVKQLTENTPLSNKLLLIVVESWGATLDNAIEQDVIQNLKNKSELFEFFNEGAFSFYGFTVEGELRELCQLYPTTVDLFQIQTGFQNCLPHKFNQLGYTTQAIHGGGSTIYGRREWYPKAGFQITTFQEQLKKPVNCIPFDGICDWDVMPFIKESFKHRPKILNYWLTLTAHFEYYSHDIHNKRFNCESHSIDANSDACRNLMLHAQFFDYLADLVSSPEMQGVEVIVVGDHPPPLFKPKDLAVYKNKHDSSKEGKIYWLHFKIKEL